MPITREAVLEQYGPVLDMDEAILIAGDHGRELSDLIDDDGPTIMRQRTTDDLVGGQKTILNYILADELFAALEA